VLEVYFKMKCCTYAVIAILVLTALILSGCGSGEGANNTTTTSSNTETTTTTYEGQVIVITYSVTTSGEMAGKWSFSPPRTGYFFLIVNLNIENHGYNKFSVSQYFFTIISNGKEYTASYVNGLPDKLAIGDVHDNESTSGNLAFEVPEGTTDFEIVYKYASSYNIQWIEQ
jgi:hypothetical protein